MKRAVRTQDDKPVTVPEIEDFDRWQSTVDEALSYMEAVADFLPHNSTLLRHVGRLRNVKMEVAECSTRHPDR